MVGCRRVVDGLAAEPTRRQRKQPARTGGGHRFIDRAGAFGRAMGRCHRPQRRNCCRHWRRGPGRRPVADRQGQELVESLKAQGHPEATEHRRNYRPWGYYQSIDQGSRYQVKRIVVRPGGRLSLQKHHHRAEHWVVVRGAAEVTLNDKVTLVHENESIYLPIGSTHRLANPGKIDVELIEVQTGSYFGEDDIVRIDDVYNRK